MLLVTYALTRDISCSVSVSHDTFDTCREPFRSRSCQAWDWRDGRPSEAVGVTRDIDSPRDEAQACDEAQVGRSILLVL